MQINPGQFKNQNFNNYRVTLVDNYKWHKLTIYSFFTSCLFYCDLREYSLKIIAFTNITKIGKVTNMIMILVVHICRVITTKFSYRERLKINGIKFINVNF